ncbi:hypothetical protein J6590_026533 [Homalodisca vitripennis]|nr:hypothetical protein J6590_026533 [Homalodisca vitripennis]
MRLLRQNKREYSVVYLFAHLARNSRLETNRNAATHLSPYSPAAIAAETVNCTTTRARRHSFTSYLEGRASNRCIVLSPPTIKRDRPPPFVHTRSQPGEYSTGKRMYWTRDVTVNSTVHERLTFDMDFGWHRHYEMSAFREPPVHVKGKE